MGYPRFQSGRPACLHPLRHALAAARIRRPGIPARVPITPHVLRPSEGQRWGPGPALRVPALRRQPTGVAVDPHPQPRLVPALTRRAAPGAAAPGGAQTAAGPRPARPAGGGAGRAQPPVPQVPHAAARAAVDAPRADPAARGDPPHDRPAGGRGGSPALAPPPGQAAPARHHWRAQPGRTRLGARAPVSPPDEAAAHGEGALPPRDAGTTPFGGPRVPWHPRHLPGPPDRRVGRVGPLGSDARAARPGRDVDPTAGGRARVAPAPPRTRPPPRHGRFGPFAAGPHGAAAHRALWPARRAAPPCKRPVLAGP
jgi:hypothetical protein